jgi:CheY-like chemotaxis protein
MADVKQILVVDDHFEMLELLRSMLQVSNEDHQVLAVPSAEEGLLELQLTKFDLLITDVRLPGMSGFDLVRRAKRVRPNMPVIMITAYLSDQGKQEAEELEVFRYFRKPLDTDSMLTAVHHALYGVPETTIAEQLDAVELKIDVHITDDVKRRLDSLRSDTGAFGLLLAAAGQVVFESGGHRDLHVDRIATIVGQKLGHSSMLAEELGGGDAFNLLYQAGTRYEFYTVNIGRFYFVTLLFEAASRRGRIGTVWVFVQRAIKELEQMLPELHIETNVSNIDIPHTTEQPPLSQKQPASVVAETPKKESKSSPKPEPEPEPEPIELSPEEMAKFEGLFAVMESADGASLDLDDFWDTAVTENDSPTTAGISLVEAQRMGLMEGQESLPESLVTEPELEKEEPELQADPLSPEEMAEFGELFTNFEPEETAVDFDSFWDEALADNDAGAGQTRGMTLEEARQQGLLSTDFDLGEHS